MFYNLPLVSDSGGVELEQSNIEMHCTTNSSEEIAANGSHERRERTFTDQSIAIYQ